MNNDKNESFDINDESFTVKTHNKDVYSAIPVAFFSEDIFNYLDGNKDLNTRNRRQKFHSVSVFPYDKKKRKIDMNSFSVVPKEPFVYKDKTNRAIGLLLNVKKNNAQLTEGGKQIFGLATILLGKISG